MNKTLKKYAQKPLNWILLIALFGALLYFQSYNYKFTADDGIYASYNQVTQKGLKQASDLFTYGSMNFTKENPTNSGIYRPFTLLTFALEKQIIGDFNPTVGHVINITLYFLLLVVIGLLLVRLMSLKNTPIVVPLLILLLYAVHPLHIEVVASIKSRDTLLSALFSLSSVYLWVHYNRVLKMWHSLAIGLIFFLALLSKEESLTLIAVVFLISWFFLNNNYLKAFIQTKPFLIAATAYLLIRQIVLEPSAPMFNSILNNLIFDTQGLEHLATNLFIYLYYIKLLIVPHPLSWDYSFSQITVKSFSDISVILSLIFFIGIIITAIKGFKKRTILSFGILFYLSTFSIFSNLIPSITIGSTLSERFMFIPSLGFCIIAVYGLYLIIKKLKLTAPNPIFISLILLIALIYSVKSWTRVPDWKNNLTLYCSGVKTAPKSWRTHMLLADELRLKAVKLTTDTLASTINKDSSQVLFKKAVVHFKKSDSLLRGKTEVLRYLQGLGECYLYLKDTLSAKEVFTRTTKDPNLFFGLFKLGRISFNEKDYTSAVKYYQEALKADSPDYFITYDRLGRSYRMLKDNKNAISAFEKALKYGSSDVIHSQLSYLYAQMGDIEKANSYRAANNKISEGELHFLKSKELGDIAYRKNNYIESRRYFEKCYPDFTTYGGTSKYPGFLNAYAHSLLQTNEVSGAKAIFKQVIDNNPKNFFALKNLGFIAFQYEKNFDQAIQFYTQSLNAKKPDLYQSYSNIGTLYLAKNDVDNAIKNYELALNFGTSPSIVKNLYLLWKSKENQDKMEYYQRMITK